MKRWLLNILAALGVAWLAMIAASGSAAASCNPSEQSCSGNYGVNETFFGIGGNSDCSSESSAHYCVKSSIGETAVGNATNGSSGHQIQAGFNTDRSPSLSLTVNATNIDLGYLSTSTAATATATFSVQTYLADGYVIQTVGNPPTNSAGSTHMLAPITTPGGAASVPGTEQFGINLADVSPTCGVSGFCTPGIIAANYGTPAKYYYNNGDTIISSSQSSSQTNYTISYLFNISPNTPAGQYDFTQAIVATSTF